MIPDDFAYEEFGGPDRGWNDEPSRTEVFRQFTSPVYTTDAQGWLTYYNEAAAALWGYRPELGRTRWCGCWRIFTPSGEPLPLDQCPMAVALREGRNVRGVQTVLERPDGTRIPFMPYPTPLRDAAGTLVAGSNVLLPITDLRPRARALPLAALPESAPDLEEEGGLDDLTGRLQATLAAMADVELDFRTDCERLEAWPGETDEKAHVRRQIEGRRRHRRGLLQARLERLQRQAHQAMLHARSAPWASTAGRATLH